MLRLLNHKNIKKLGLTLVGFCLAVLLNVTVSQATTGPQIAGTPGQSSSQIEKVDYFFLQTKPKQKQTVTLKVTNLSLDEQTVKIVPTTAGTSDSGQISYDPNIQPKDQSLKYKFTDLIAEKSKKVTIPGNNTADVDFTLTPPKQSYAGIIMGGFYVTTNADAIKTKNKISNQFALVMPVQLREKKSKIVPKLAINQVKLAQGDLQTKLNSEIANQAPNTITGMKFSDQIYREGTKNKLLSKNSYNNFSMAPNSHFNLTTNLGNKVLIPGTYYYEINASDDNGNHWKLKKSFKVNLVQSAKYTTSYNWWNLLIGILVIVALILIYVVLKQRKKIKRRH